MKSLFAVAPLTVAVLLGAQSAPPVMIEWVHQGSEQSQSKYSVASDMTPSNVGRLEIAWQWRPNERPLADGTQPGNFQATPIMVDNVLYLSTSFNRVVALNAQTGAELWVFDPKAYLDGPGINLYYQHRGVALWREGNDARVFMNSHDRLLALDARTGQLVTSFGQGG
jgi:quinoprotein glucose dehydrogenase